MNDKELLPCPFTGEKPDLYIYDVEDGYEGKIAVDSIDLAIYFDGKDKEEVKEKLLNIWNNRVYPPEVQEAIEKHNPKKPKKDIVHYRCPNCDAMLNIYEIFHCCNHCGQKLDWSDV